MPTRIEWADESWNPIRARRIVDGVERIGWHCEHASDGCRHCYAETQNYAGRSRFTGTRLKYKPGHRRDVEIYLDAGKLVEPLRWWRPRGIFPLSMSDLFGDWVEAAWIDRIFAVMGLCPHHDFRVLTKRSPRMRAYLSWPALGDRVHGHMCAIAARLGRPMPDKPQWPLRNVWLGVSVEDQKAAELRVPDLLATPAAVRWLSCEPLIGAVDLTRLRVPGCTWVNALTGAVHAGPAVYYEEASIDWVVAGLESGPKARPGHPDWIRSLRDQCGADTPFPAAAFFFKQWGEWAPLPGARPADESFSGFAAWPDGTIDRGTPERLGQKGIVLYRATKKVAGRLLDGVLYDAMPVLSAAEAPEAANG